MKHLKWEYTLKNEDIADCKNCGRNYQICDIFVMGIPEAKKNIRNRKINRMNILIMAYSFPKAMTGANYKYIYFREQQAGWIPRLYMLVNHIHTKSKEIGK